METLRLKRIRQPPQVERLLERLVVQAGLVPANAYQLRDPGGLPSALERVILETTKIDRVWACWADGSRTRLFTGEMSLPLSRKRGAPVLMVTEYSEQGSLQEAGHWTFDGEGNWRRCTD